MRPPVLRIILTVLALAWSLALGPPAQAWPRHGPRGGPPPPDGPPGEPPGGLVARHAERLGLDAATRAAIERVAAESRARDESLGAEIDAAREALRERLSEPSPDADGVLAQADALGALETEAHKNRLRAMLEIRSLLTPEQRAELQRIRDEHGPPFPHGPLGLCSRDFAEHCAQASGLEGISCLRERWQELSERYRGAFEFPPRRPIGSSDPRH